VSGTARGHLAMLAFSALIAGSFALGSMAANHIAPTALNAVRFLLAAVVIGILAQTAVGLKRRDFAAPWRYLLLGGAMGLYFVLMFEGLKTAPPVSAAAVFTLTPVIAGLFGFLLLRQIMTPRMWMALAIGAVVFSFGVVVGAALLVTMAGWRDLAVTDWTGLPPVVWVTILYTSIFATVATFILLQYASLRLPSAKVMAYTYLTPTWVICWQIALGHQVPHNLVLIGVGLTIVALLMLLKEERRV